jgi:hypothetical protein
MKIAQQLAALDTTAAAAQAQQRAIAVDQVWAGEGYTKYTFDDNSVLIQSGAGQYGMDADDFDSIDGYGKWLGKDVAVELKEIQRLIEAI